ncbi:MAG: diaminopimelate decarboxylase, partial [Actinomycetia bacterium]|nr:diaminopimelate decarboxylase [Actinomycetes bacterium]
LESVKKEFKELNLKIPKIKVEPGRSIIGNSCVTLYLIGTIKEIPGVRKYVSVDGGMADNIRPMLYSSKYDAFLANKAGEERVEKVTVSGKHCESGDILVKDVVIQKPETGDILCIPATGAYCYAMSSNYNKLPKPAVIMVKDGESRVIIRRETNDDLLYLENIINRGEKNE